MARTGNAYQRIDPAVLCFFNTTECQRCMILAYFMYKMAFDDRLEHENYCDNCMYNNAEARQVPEFHGYNVTARLNMIYEHTIEYSNLLLSSERNRLLTTNPIRNPRTTVE